MKWVLAMGFCLVGCASAGGFRLPENDDSASRAPGAAYAGSGMNFRKDMPHQSDPKPWQFYFKHCSINGDESFYSRTSYDCTGPAF
jgi:hypothetical protein